MPAPFDRDAPTLGSFSSAGATVGQSSLSLRYRTNQSSIAREHPSNASSLDAKSKKKGILSFLWLPKVIACCHLSPRRKPGSSPAGRGIVLSKAWNRSFLDSGFRRNDDIKLAQIGQNFWQHVYRDRSGMGNPLLCPLLLTRLSKSLPLENRVRGQRSSHVVSSEGDIPSFPNNWLSSGADLLRPASEHQVRNTRRYGHIMEFSGLVRAVLIAPLKELQKYLYIT